MYKEEVEKFGNIAKKKIDYMSQNPFGLLILSMLAGMFVGFGIILINTIGGSLKGAVYTKLVMGMSFGIALSLVVLAGSELFTGNTLVMGLGIFKKQVKFLKVIKFLIICYIGNWIGSILIAYLFYLAGYQKGAVGEFITNSSYLKMTAGFMPLFIRGILCNILVCLATWCGTKLQSESGKLIMIFWCLFAFITSGFEHSIANMSLLTIGMLNPIGKTLTLGMYFNNILVVTLGNIVGGVLFVALPYYIASLSKKES